MKHDILRIMAERETFTQEDIAADTELSLQHISKLFQLLCSAGRIERVRVGHYWLYGLTERGKQIASRLPAIDTEERVLPLTFEGIVAEGELK